MIRVFKNRSFLLYFALSKKFRGALDFAWVVANGEPPIFALSKNRREWDSNPRYAFSDVQRFSKPPP